MRQGITRDPAGHFRSWTREHLCFGSGIRIWRWLSLVAIILASATLGALPAAAIPVEKTQPAGNIISPPDTGAAPLNLSVGLYVTNLTAIHEAEEYFQITGYLFMSLHDDRLAQDAESGPGLRHVRDTDVWIPPIEFANAIKFHRHSYVLKVDAKGLVQYTEYFDADLSNDFWLSRFPFDRQVLDVVLSPFLSRKMTIIFASDDVGSGVSAEPYAGLAAWKIEGLEYVPALVPAYGIMRQIPQARFEITVSRRAGFYIWKVFLPMIVMTIIPWSVFWVDTKEFDWQMKIPIATMLALVAFEFAIARDLPRVPYVTFLDAVFLTCFIFVFICIVEIVTVHAMVRNNMRSVADKIHWHSRWVVPLAYVCTLLVLVPIFFHGAEQAGWLQPLPGFS